MHKLITVLLSIMLIAAPVYAQETVSPDNLDRVLQFIREVGAPWSVLILIVVVAGRIIKPMSDSFVENSRARTESERASRGVLESTARALNDNAVALKGVAESMGRMASIMNGLSTKSGNDELARGVVKQVNDHTDKTLEQARSQLIGAAADLERERAAIEDVVTKDHLTRQLRPILEQLQEMSEALRKADTGEMPSTAESGEHPIDTNTPGEAPEKE